MNHFIHSGDLGDILASLASVKRLGGGTMYLVDRPWTKALTPRAHLIRSLLESQPYIDRVVIGEPPEGISPVFDFSTFRSGGLPWGKTLGAIQSDWVKAKGIDWKQPWLEVEAAKGFEDKVILARSHRYNEVTFPWRKVVEFFGDSALFIGIPEERATFEQNFGKVEYLPTAGLRELFTIIKGSALFIGNQSSPFNGAEAMKHPRILEVCTWVPDCCYGGGDVQYVCDGVVTLRHPKTGETLTTKPWMPPRELDLNVVPPGGWSYTMPDGHVFKSYSFDQVLLMMRQAFLMPGAPAAPSDLRQALIDETLSRLPADFGVPRWFTAQQTQFRRVQEILKTL